MRRRRSLLVGGVVVLAAVIVGVANADATLPAEVEVADSECHDGELAGLTLRVAYGGEEPVGAHVHVWDQQQKTQYTWLPETITLQPGTATYTLTAPEENARVTAGKPAQVAVNVGQQRAITNWQAKQCVAEVAIG